MKEDVLAHVDGNGGQAAAPAKPAEAAPSEPSAPPPGAADARPDAALARYMTREPRDPDGDQLPHDLGRDARRRRRQLNEALKARARAT